MDRTACRQGGFSIDNVFSGGFSSTEADKTKKYKLYLENYFADQLETLSNVESASVTLDIPNDDGTILAREQDSYAAVILTLNSDMSDEQAQGLAQYIATQLGNDTTDNVLILDSNSNVLSRAGIPTRRLERQAVSFPSRPRRRICSRAR